MMNMRYGSWLICAVLLSSPALAFNGDPERGGRIYQQRCALCHGADGRGNDGMAVDFRSEWHRLSKPDTELAMNIRSGFQSPNKNYRAGPMPPQILNDRDLRDVLAFIRDRFTR